MITKFKQFAKKHQVLTFWLLAILLAALIIPAALYVFNTFPNVTDEMDKVNNGKGYNTNILYSLPIALKVTGGAWFALVLLAWPATASISAVLTSLLLKGKKGLKELLSRFRFWSPKLTFKQGIKVWIQMILFVVGIKLLFSLLLNIFGGVPFSESFSIHTKYGTGEILFIFITSLLFDGGGLMEELGWRGFALPRLQKKYNPLKATIILGTIWALWHIPIKTDVLSSFSDFAIFYLFFTFVAILYSIIMTYFYNRVGGSVLITVAIHGLLNDSAGFGGILTPDSVEISDTFATLLYAGVFVLGAAIILIIAGKNLGFNKELDSLPETETDLANEENTDVNNVKLVTQ
jgi:membrane protease YdiL (CAAX protease family)